MDSKIDLNSLMLFYEVIEAGSLTAASVKLGLAKSTVSRRLASLERQFGSVLVKKNSRKLTLTEVGASLHKRCQKIAAEVQEATWQALGVHSNMQGLLRVSVPGDLGIDWLANVIADFTRLYPELTVAVRIHNTDIVDPIKEPFDIAIQIGEQRPNQAVCKHLATFSRGIYASPDYLARRGIPRSVADCYGHDWIVIDVQERDGVLLVRRSSKWRVIGAAHKIVANSARLARGLAILGLGLTLLPDVLAEDAVRNRRLVRVLVDWTSPPLHVVALFISRDRIPRKTRVFLEFVAERMLNGVRSVRVSPQPPLRARTKRSS